MIMVLGYFVGTTWVTAYTLLQETVTDEFRGRTFGSLTVMSRLTLFMALVVFPFVSAVIAKALPANPHLVVLGQNFDLSGTRLALALAALMVLIGGLYMRRSLGKFRRTKSEPLGLVPKLKKPPSQGVFVVFEGVEGSGKGTQIERAQRWIQTFGRDVLVTREPGGTSMGEQLREILLDHDTGKLEPKTEAMLFGAARAQLVSTVIRPALEQGKVVLCDRYIDSSLAYQGVARGLGDQRGGAHRDAELVWHDSFLRQQVERPQRQGKVDASDFFNLDSVSHELKYGAGYRTAESSTSTAWT
jgi:dTMP kinase